MPTSDDEDEFPISRRRYLVEDNSQERKRKKMKLQEEDDEESEMKKNQKGEEEEEESELEDAKPLGEVVRVSAKGRGRRNHYEAFEFDGTRYDLVSSYLHLGFFFSFFGFFFRWESLLPVWIMDLGVYVFYAAFLMGFELLLLHLFI